MLPDSTAPRGRGRVAGAHRMATFRVAGAGPLLWASLSAETRPPAVAEAVTLRRQRPESRRCWRRFLPSLGGETGRQGTLCGHERRRGGVGDWIDCRRGREEVAPFRHQGRSRLRSPLKDGLTFPLIYNLNICKLMDARVTV